MTVAASLGVVLAAAYLLWMLQRVLYGELSNPENARLPDLSPREATVLVPLVALAIFMGLASPLFTRTIEPSLDRMLRQVRARSAPAPDAVQSVAAGPGALR
jgi:NADH-quinone oxidoreductase subunit M